MAQNKDLSIIKASFVASAIAIYSPSVVDITIVVCKQAFLLTAHNTTSKCKNIS
jgi:hypothetical protein